MRETLYMAWRYLAYNRIKTTQLVLSTTLILFLPAGLKTLVGRSARALTARAEATPLVIGAKGSPLELVLNSLYFESAPPETIPYAEVARVSGSKLANAIPLYTRFRARRFPLVGTTIDYFDFRGLSLASGRKMAVLGECVVGSEVAAQLGIDVGESIVSSPENAFDLAGAYPLKMKVVGVLAPTGTPDDRAVLADLKTAWVIAGLAHGHQDMAKPEAAQGVLKREGNTIVANAAVMQYNEITPDNIGAFHFHGDPSTFPITAVVALPHDQKSSTLLQGRYLADNERMQAVMPSDVMEELLRTVLTVQNYFIAGVLVIGLSTLTLSILVFALSLRLREREIETMHRIGGSRHRVAGLLAAEVGVVVVLATGLATVMTLMAGHLGEWLIRMVIL